MKRCFGLLSRIADDYRLIQGITESESDYKARIIYSFLGQCGLASLWDIQDDDNSSGTISVAHFKQRIMNLINSLMQVYPEMMGVFPDIQQLCEEIYSTFLKAGYMYHKTQRLSPPMYSLSRAGDNIYVRGQAVSEILPVSGLGSYRLADASDSGKQHFRTLRDMFALSENTLADFWEHLTQNIHWQNFSSYLQPEYLNMTPRKYSRNWVNTYPPEGVICMARMRSVSVYQYFLCRLFDGKILLSSLPNWIDHRAAMSACLAANGTLPPIKYHHDGSIVKITFGCILPNAEMNLVRLYSWPVKYSDFPADFVRVMNSDIFDSIRPVLSSTGFDFKEA